ncbi:MAG TPA: rod shape-determining protein MreC [Thermohalobaculum sp.]|nr:rod shape-determining protein MreC [Thermohalobaculum sp.]
MPLPAESPDRALTRTVHRLLLGLIVLVSLALLILWRTDNPRLERVRMSVIDTLAPSMSMVNGPLDFAWHVGRDYREFIDVYDQNRALRREIQSLRSWRERARLLEEENAQLRALNNVRLPPRTTFVAGDVIADSGGPFREAVLVNVGRSDQIEDGAAAVDGLGLVGRVVGVGARASRLLLLTDFSSRVPVIIQPGARRAMLSGDGTALPKLEFLDAGERIQPGDLVETTGDGGVFPPDLPVGHVVATASGTWRVSLLADYARLEFVRLLRYEPDTGIDQPGDLVLPRPGATADPAGAEVQAAEPNLAGTASN